MPDPISLITAPARIGLRLAILPLQALRRLTGAQQPSFDDNDPSGPEPAGPAGGTAAAAAAATIVAEPARTPNGSGATLAPPTRKPRARPRANRGVTPPRKRAAEPTRGEMADRREALREAEAGDDSPGPEIHVDEPWEGYAAMSAADVVQRLADAPPAVAAMVRLYENQHDRREAVLRATEG